MVFLLARRANVPKEIYPREMEPRVQLCALTWAANCDLGVLSNKGEFFIMSVENAPKN